MAPGERRLEIHFTALSFVAPEAVRFRHRLEPLEKEWVETGTRRFVNYSFVPPGEYTFRVIACNNDGVWSQTGAHLRVRVLPQFWETWLFRGTLAALAMVALIGGVILDGRRRLRRRLERLESERAVERERTRIAQDIHDDLGASLTRILMLTQEGSLESESKEAVEESIRQVHTTARELTREMDEIVWAVNPEHDTLESLVNYLCRYGQTFLNAAHLRCRLDVPVDLPGWPVRAEVRHNLFLAFKEILNNIVRHAGATEVRLAVSLSPTEFRLTLRDDGRGFAGEPQTELEPEGEDSDRIATGLGLESIQRRLTRVGGRFEVKGLQGEGTTCELRVPLQSMSARPIHKKR
jgi:signal transduction histidine kinase